MSDATNAPDPVSARLEKLFKLKLPMAPDPLPPMATEPAKEPENQEPPQPNSGD